MNSRTYMQSFAMSKFLTITSMPVYVTVKLEWDDLLVFVVCKVVFAVFWLFVLEKKGRARLS